MPHSRRRSGSRGETSKGESSQSVPVPGRSGGWSLDGRLGDMACSAVFFGLFYAYLWLVVEPCLIYDCGTITNFPIFYKGWAFLGESMSLPGGSLHYLSALLSQLFYHPWAGALVITAQAWALCACTGWLFQTFAVPGGRLLRFVPAVLVLITYARYSYHLPTTMGALASLFLTCLYIGVEPGGEVRDDAARRTRAAWSGSVVLVIFSLVSYTLSAGAFLLFAGLCAAYELLYRRWYRMGLAHLLCAAMVPYVLGVLAFHVSVVDAYTDMLPVSWRILGWPGRANAVWAVHALYLFPLAAVILSWVARAVRAPNHDSAHRIPHSTFYRTAHSWSGTVQWVGGSLVLFAGAGAVALAALDREEKTLLQVHHYACRKMWPEVLQAAGGRPDNPAVVNAVNRALWHTGRLNRDMFSRFQHPDGLLVVGDDRVLRHWHKFDTLIDLGLMNLAEKNLAECMEAFGEQPMILQRLATINMVKGRTDSARIYLGALSKTLFHADWAKEYLARIEKDPNLSDDPQIRRLRAQCIGRDFTSQFYAKEPLLMALVEQGNSNRMAFEYLMAWYMLNRQLEKVVQNVGRLREFGYSEIPPLFQEALLIYVYGTRKPIPLGGYTVHPDAQRRIERFNTIFNRHNKNKDAAAADLVKEFRNSYFFYYIYAP